MTGDFNVYVDSQGNRVLDWKHSTLDEMLSYRAFSTGDAMVFGYLGDGETLTHSMTAQQMHDWAQQVAARIARFVPERSHVLLLFNNGLDYLAGFFGCLYANIVPVSGVYPMAAGSRERFAAIVQDSRAAAVLGLKQTLTDFRQAAPASAAGLKWIPLDGAPTGETLYRRRHARVSDVAFVQYTSGSTRIPRGVMLTHENLGYNLQAQVVSFEFSTKDRGVSWLPLSHDMGLIGGPLQALTGGAPCIMMSPHHFIEKPERWPRAVSRFRARISGGPNFAYDLCTRMVPDSAVKDMDLSCWDMAFNGADVIDRQTVENFARKFAPAGFEARAFYPCYGMAEGTLLAAGGTRRDPIQFTAFSRTGLARNDVRSPEDAFDARMIANCGMAVGTQEIRVVDPDTERPVQEGRVGELWHTGSSIAPGYLNRPEETREKLDAQLDGKRYYRSGDLGFYFDGALYVCGRIESRICYNGRYFDPDDLIKITRNASSELAERSLTVFLQDDVLTVLCEGPAAIGLQEARRLSLVFAQALYRTCRFARVRAVFLKAGGILKTPSGKVQVSATREALLAGALPVIQDITFEEEAFSSVDFLDRSALRL